jgi:FixJ family two-component response regulator
MTNEQILVVDHLDDRREHLVQLLESQGRRVVRARSCEECLGLLDKESFAVILSETELPKKSGLFLLKEAKARSTNTEVILLTHNASSFTLLQALRQGAYDFILRPIDSGDILSNTVGRALEHIRQRKERENLLKALKIKNQALDHALHRMKSLNENICRMAQSDQVEEIFTIMLEAAVQEVKAENGLICLLTRAGDKLGLKISQNIPAAISSRFSSGLPAGLIEVIARRSKPVLVPAQLPQGLAVLVDQQEQQGLLKLPGLLSVPLRLNNRIAGVMLLSGHPPRRPFAEHDLLYLIQLATHAQLLLEKIGQLHLLKKKTGGKLPAAVGMALK